MLANFGTGSRRRFSYERKFVDLAAASYAANTTGSITLIPVIPQGASASQRIGKKAVLKSIQAHGLLVSDNTTLVTNGRYLLVWDRQPNAVLPAITAVLDTANYMSFTNDSNKDRFLILRDKKFAVAGNNLTAGQQTDRSIHAINFFQRLPNLETHYGTVGDGTIGDINSGALYLVTVGSTASGTADCNFQFGFRVRYIDP